MFPDWKGWYTTSDLWIPFEMLVGIPCGIVESMHIIDETWRNLAHLTTCLAQSHKCYSRQARRHSAWTYRVTGVWSSGFRRNFGPNGQTLGCLSHWTLQETCLNNSEDGRYANSPTPLFNMSSYSWSCQYAMFRNRAVRLNLSFTFISPLPHLSRSWVGKRKRKRSSMS